MAMRPRHLFLPSYAKPWAYLDRPLPIGNGQTISQPSMVAEMVSLLEAKPGQKILEVGAGSGWAAAILSNLVKKEGHVYAIEYDAELADMAKRNIERLCLNNVTIYGGRDGGLGLPEEGPFDSIIFSCGVPRNPDKVNALLDVLKIQLKKGGMVVLPLTEEGGTNGHLVKMILNEDGNFTMYDRGEVGFVPLRGRFGHGTEVATVSEKTLTAVANKGEPSTTSSQQPELAPDIRVMPDPKDDGKRGGILNPGMAPGPAMQQYAASMLRAADKGGTSEGNDGFKRRGKKDEERWKRDNEAAFYVQEEIIETLGISGRRLHLSTTFIGDTPVDITQYKNDRGGVIPFFRVGKFIVLQKKYLDKMNYKVKQYPYLIVLEYDDFDIAYDYQYNYSWSGYTIGVLAAMLACEDQIRGSRFIDAGAGATGIFSIAAKMLGASQFVVIENNVLRIPQLKNNLVMNHLEQYDLYEEDIQAIKSLQSDTGTIIALNLPGYGTLTNDGDESGELEGILGSVSNMKLAIISGGSCNKPAQEIEESITNILLTRGAEKVEKISVEKDVGTGFSNIHYYPTFIASFPEMASKIPPASEQCHTAPQGSGQAVRLLAAEESEEGRPPHNDVKRDITNALEVRSTILPEEEKVDQGTYYTVRYNDTKIPRGSPAEALLKVYVEQFLPMGMSGKDRFELKGSNKQDQGIIWVECYKDQARSESQKIGVGHVDIEEDIAGKILGIPGMVNIALLASHIPINTTMSPDEIMTTYAGLISRIKAQYEKMIESPLTDDDVRRAIVNDRSNGFHITLPHAERIPIEEQPGYYQRMTVELQQAA